MSETMIEVTGLGKRFGALTALRDVDLAVPRGTVLGLLGHNGAGKTTLVNVLATLTRPSGGTARVAGFDVVAQAHQVRRRIGIAGQYATVDEQMTGTQNLILLARLLGADRRSALARTRSLLERFDLTAVADRTVRTYSGGTRRRLDLAASMVGRPEVVFLDEPTTGLDPVSRLTMWRLVRDIARTGSTVLLTTQHLEEADTLADSIMVLSRGRVVASGSPAQLKARVGQRKITVGLAPGADPLPAVAALRNAGLDPSCDLARRVVTVTGARTRDLTRVVRALDAAAIEPDELTMTEPGLDEVYLTLACTPEGVPG
ncbi:ATP-binding cassette domain-containing protein [Thermomonospora umbrina]|uniref:ABC-2 type transport system ATP-binding protein n=1 Tax=Thermomonospora umbrina TaxID=111806 RepID=A0A3D9SMF9_9ACTN|nr:ATP-binding cassette domain-containing protein [Thermomonospora umbrina]REE96917.1 ABC-2 type transport system ATP-binding protein [Thermomonospora umbrina]